MGTASEPAEMAPPTNLRTTGGLVVLSTPISALISFAALATVFGEERLEDSNGLTALGWASVALPPLFGLALIAWSFTDRPLPPAGRLRIIGFGFGLAAFVLGAIATATGPSGDPSIGGGLLIIAGVAMMAASVISGRPAPD